MEPTLQELLALAAQEQSGPPDPRMPYAPMPQMDEMEGFQEFAPQEQTPNDYWSRVAMQSGGQGPFQNIRMSRNPTGLEALLGLVSGFANAKTRGAAGRIGEVEDRNTRTRAAASELGKRRWEVERDRRREAAATRENILQSQLTSSRDAAKEARTASAKGPAPPYDPEMLMKVSSGMRMDQDLNKHREIQFGHGLVQTGAKLNSPQGDISIVFGYMKMLDPLSVVREGEFATAENTAGVPERIRTQYNKMLRGERLSPDQRTGFVSAAKAHLVQARQRSDRANNKWRRVAQDLKLPWDRLSGGDDPIEGAAPSNGESFPGYTP